MVHRSTEATRLGWDRITRKKAFALVFAEKYRRATDYAFSGYAPIEILPYADLLTGQFERLARNMGVIYSDYFDIQKRLYSDDGVIFE